MRTLEAYIYIHVCVLTTYGNTNGAGLRMTVDALRMWNRLLFGQDPRVPGYCMSYLYFSVLIAYQNMRDDRKGAPEPFPLSALGVKWHCGAVPPYVQGKAS